MNKSVFLSGPLRVEILPDGMSARLTHAFCVRLASDRIIEVPVGFVTDFASVPRLFWRIVPPWGAYSPAAVVHDYLYQNHLVSREEADRIFLELMTVLGVLPWKRKTMYWAVRIGGWVAWNASQEADTAKQNPMPGAKPGQPEKH